MGWIDGLISSFDIESTSPDPEEARIVTATLVAIEPGNTPLVKQWLADPGVDIPAEATAIHGITTEHAQAHGRPAKEVVDEVRLALADAWVDGPIVICNASYDLTVVTHECARHHQAPFEVTGPVIDPYIIDKGVDRYRKGKRKLPDLCAHYRVRHDGAHDSTEDALAAARVVWRIARQYRQISTVTLEQLQQLQRDWFAEQQSSFADYLRRKIAPGITDDTERAGVLARADQVATDLRGWPVRGAS